MNVRAIPTASPSAWYRQRWPWMLFAGPAIVVVAGFFTAWLAIRSDDGVVAADYYKRGLLINREMDRLRRGEGIAASGSITGDGTVRIRLSGAGDVSPPVLMVQFAHPTRAGRDRTLALEADGSGAYVGSLGTPAGARWLVRIGTDDWQLPAIETAIPVAALHAGAEAASGPRTAKEEGR